MTTITVTWWSLLSSVALVTYVTLAVLLVARRPRSLVRWSSALILVSLAFWAFEDIFHGNPLLTVQDVRFFSDIGTIGRVSFPSLFLWFSLLLTRHPRLARRWWTWPLLVLVPAAFALALWTGALPATARPVPAGWIVFWHWSPLTLGFCAYMLVFITCGLILLLRARPALSDPADRQRINMIAVGTATSLVLGSVFDIGLAALPTVGTPELASTFGLIWALTLYVGVSRFGRRRVTPQAAAVDILATMADAVLLLGPDGRIVAANQSLTELVGLAEDALRGRVAAELCTQPDALRDALGEVAATGRVSHIAIELRHRDGHTTPVSAGGRLMHRRKAPLGSVWVLRDMTALRRSDRELRATEDRYRSFVEQLQGIAFRGGLDYSIEFLHGAVKSITGYSAHEFLSGAVRWRDLICPDDVERLRLGTEQLRTVPDTALVRDYRLLRRDGSIGWVREATHNLSDESGRPVRLEGLIFDVSEQRRALDELSRLSQFREGIIDSANVLLAAADRDFNILVWNRAAEAVTGYPRDAVVGSSEVWAQLYPDPDDRSQFQELARAIAGSGRTSEVLETTVQCRDGSARTIAWTLRPLFAADAAPVGFIALGQDTTEQRQSEEQRAEQVRNVAFLSQTARELAELPHEGDIYSYVGERLRQASGAAVVFVNSYEPQSRSLLVRSTLGIERRAAEVTTLLGRSPEGLVVPLPDPVRENLLSGRVLAVENGLSGLALGALPDIVCRGVERLLDTGRAYSIGFSWQGELYGNASFLMRSGTELGDPGVIETFVHQAAIALRRRHVEEVLRQSEASFRTLTEDAADGIAVLDDQGIYLYANRRASELLGAPLDQVVGSSFERWVRPEDLEMLRERSARRQRGEPVPAHYELTGLQPDGTEYRIEVAASRTTWHGSPATLVIVRDIGGRSPV